MRWAAEELVEVAAGDVQVALGDAAMGVGEHGRDDLRQSGADPHLGVLLDG
jgi:hypothetical protein